MYGRPMSADRGERTKQAIERGSVRIGGGSELVARARPVGEQVGEAQRGGDRDRLAHVGSGDQPMHRLERRLLH
jgi:hypothetical protein